MEFKKPKDLETNRDGEVMNIKMDESLIGMPNQEFTPYEPFVTEGKMRRSKGQSKVFDNNGGESKADGAGVINKNGEYGSITYGF